MKKAESAISAMILFIAIIIIAAGVATVMFQISQSLQTSASSGAQDSRIQASTKLQINAITANNGSINQLRNFFIDTRLTPGSTPIKLNNTLIYLTLTNRTVILTYTPKPCVNVSGPGENGYYTNTVTSSTGVTGNFSVMYLSTGLNYSTGRMDEDDIIRICFQMPRYILSGEQINLRLAPVTASPTSTNFFIPNPIVSQVTQVYP